MTIEVSLKTIVKMFYKKIILAFSDKLPEIFLHKVDTGKNKIFKKTWGFLKIFLSNFIFTNTSSKDPVQVCNVNHISA